MKSHGSDVQDMFQEKWRLFLEKASTYLTAQELSGVSQAFELAKVAHAQQKRVNGLPYIFHPLAVAFELLEWQMDAEVLAAAFLHDVAEDSGISISSLQRQFGRTIARLVDGVSKLKHLAPSLASSEKMASFRKMVLAASQDIRVILIKLSDRLHNMQTLHAFQERSKKERIAKETLEIYAPIARRLGMDALSRQLEDLAFFHLFPKRYKVIQKAMRKVHRDQAPAIHAVLKKIRRMLLIAGIGATVLEREKNLYRIYRKMRAKKLSFFKILDLYSCQIIVNDQKHCYTVLGLLHALYKPIIHKIKDYIAIPKNNYYQALHTLLLGPKGFPVEVQIFTPAMYQKAERGIVENRAALSGKYRTSPKAYPWLHDILSIEKGDEADFFEGVRTDLSASPLYVFTKEGEVIDLPKGATALDFAYAIDVNLAHHTSFAKINHLKKPFNTLLKDGDMVEIIKSDKKTPDPTWLNNVVTHQALFAIRHFMRQLPFEEAVKAGRGLLKNALGVLEYPLVLSKTLQRQYLDHFYPQKTDFSEVLADVGRGYASPVLLSQQLLFLVGEHKKWNERLVTIDGNDSGVIFASCCRPILGDPVKAVMNEQNALVIHRDLCKFIYKQKDPVKVQLNRASKSTYEAILQLLVYNEFDALAKITKAISQALSNIEGVSTQKTVDENIVRLFFRLRVQDTDHLDLILGNISQIDSVLSAKRC